MSFYEYHVHPEVDLEKMAETLRKLGWSGVCFVCRSLEEIEGFRRKLGRTELDVAFGYKIETNKPDNVPKIAKKVRKKVELVLVNGGDLEVNRKACETSEVDILTHPELGRNDPGLDYVFAKLARKNNVSIEFNFRNILLSYKKSRSDIFSNMLENAKLVRKYGTPFILSTGAIEHFDLRSPSELISFGRVLGLDSKEIKTNLSGKILQENRKRLGKKWVMPGVELE
jgi:ribonuclease P/MRP protein subunit RPP1